MDILLVLLCCGSLVATTAFGLGLSFVLERFLGGWAYVVGALLPVIVFTGFYTLYHIWVRANPCEPLGSLACGEPFFTAFFLFLGVAFVVLIANILAQTALYLGLYGRHSQPAALYDNAGDESGAEPGADMGAHADAVSEETEPLAEMPADDQFVDEQYASETDYSGHPPDNPEEEPPR